VLAFRNTLVSTVELSCQRQFLFRRVDFQWNLRLLSREAEAGSRGIGFSGRSFGRGKITAVIDSADRSATWISRYRPAAIVPQYTGLHWESFALRRTPLPQDDRVWELNRPAAGLRYPPVRRGRRVRPQIVLPSKRPITVFVLPSCSNGRIWVHSDGGK
jgi:hypothetical protein